jgi:hypothetical protein
MTAPSDSTRRASVASRPEPSAPQTARQSLNDHAAAKGAEIHDKFGPRIGWPELLRILDDRNCVRYPCEIAFDAAPLLPGELAHPVAKGARPEDGFRLHVHPLLLSQLDRVCYPVLYQLVVVNYGPFASADDAEAFGAQALGISTEEYYQTLCQMTDALAHAQRGPCSSPPPDGLARTS